MDGGDAVAVVYAKGESVRVPGKNARFLGGEPLFWHITETATKCPLISRVIVDTDCKAIADYATDRGVETVDRPKWLTNHDATGDNLVVNTAERIDCQSILQLYPTSPFVSENSLRKAIVALERYNSATGVLVSKEYVWRDGKPAERVIPSQQLTPLIRETTGFYATRRSYVMEKRTRVDPDSCFGVVLSHVESVDINYEADFEFARIVWAGLQWKAR